MTDEQVLNTAFERAMLPVRALGWHLTLHYQPAANSFIYASHAVYPPQVYTKMVFTQHHVVPVYERWFSSCAALLTQLAAESPA